MLDIPLEFRVRDYVTDQGVPARSLRPFVAIQCGTLRPLCFVDTGAPFCIVSFSVGRRIPWQRLGIRLLFQGKPAPLDWQGVACEFGETAVVLHDPASGVSTGACRLVGKFAQARHPSLENYVLLGMNFLVDNNIDLIIRSKPGSVTGMLSVP